MDQPRHFWRRKGRRLLARGVTATIPKRVPLAWLQWGVLGIASVLLISVATIASPNAAVPDEASRGQAGRKAPTGMGWVPGGTFLMGTDDVSSFPNERPAHQVHIAEFWMDDHDVTNAEFAQFVEATGYVTTSERKPDWEELKKELPPGTPKPDDSKLVAGSLVFTPTARPGAARRSFSLVAMGTRRRLAASGRSGKQYRRSGESSGCPGVLV